MDFSPTFIAYVKSDLSRVKMPHLDIYNDIINETKFHLASNFEIIWPRVNYCGRYTTVLYPMDKALLLL